MVSLDPGSVDAFAVDLDGVVTRTAAVHAAAWKRLFDDFLARRAGGKEFAPFEQHDYRTYVDGKPRRDGVRAFLAARGIELPEGSADDDPEADSIHGMAARKNRYFQEVLARSGVEVFPDAVALLRRARAQHVSLAIVSASENCAAVLAAARIRELFDVEVDGRDAIALGLRGKPAPDTFLEAARRLHRNPQRIAVFEDAIAGVEAGRAGGFGIVIGVARAGTADALRAAGAHHVVSTLDEIEIASADTRRVNR